MDALVEVHDETSWSGRWSCGRRLIGINNRNLKTLEVSLATTEALAPLVPPDVVADQRVGHPTRRRRRRSLRPLVDGFLVGTVSCGATTWPRGRELVYGRVKVCGLTAPRTPARPGGGASLGGLIFAAESPRA